MKFNFSKTTQKLIDTIALLPSRVTTLDEAKLPVVLFSKYMYDIAQQNVNRATKVEIVVKNYNDRKFLSLIVRAANSKYYDELSKEYLNSVRLGEVNRGPVVLNQLKETKAFLVSEDMIKSFKDIKNGEILKDPEIVRHGLNCSVIVLSKEEIQKLL